MLFADVFPVIPYCFEEYYCRCPRVFSYGFDIAVMRLIDVFESR